MIELLLEIKERVDAEKLVSEALNPDEIAAFEQRYDSIVASGYLANPPPESAKKRGRKKQGKARNMLNRLSSHRHEVLAFMRDFRVPFDNNRALSSGLDNPQDLHKPLFSADLLLRS